MSCTESAGVGEAGSELERVVLDGIGRLVGLEKVRFHALADSDLARRGRRPETAEFRLTVRLRRRLEGDLESAGEWREIRLEDWESNLPPETLRWRAVDESTVEVRTAFIPSAGDLDLILRLVLWGMHEFFSGTFEARGDSTLLDLEGELVVFRDGSEVPLKSFSRRDLRVRAEPEGPVLEGYWARRGESPRRQLWRLVNAGLSRLKRRPLHAYVLRRDAIEGWVAMVDGRWGGLYGAGAAARRPPGADFNTA